ncbi:MAG: hypothetical protein KKA65_02765, partial [Nanoarchaeota archaeon]|nr:hypothetical protein [Nanoarchaeota archaeon]MBU4456399.1 hypothetical protein [Nanoarchaeota archaeon]
MSLTSKITKIIGGTIAVISLSVVLVGSYLGFKQLNDDMIGDERFKSVYHNALKQYADTNKDGFVSTIEKDAFDKDLLKDKDVNLIVGQRPKYNKNGN